MVYIRKVLNLIIIIAAIIAASFIIFFAIRRNEVAKAEKAGELLSELPNEKTYIYGDRQAYSEGLYSGLYLIVNGKSSYFKWKSENFSFAPRITYADLDGNGKNELVIILTEAEGTGVHKSAVHVLDPDSFKETPVENPLDIISQNAESSIVHISGKVTVSVVVNGQRFEKVFNEDYSPSWIKDKPAFGSIVRYDVKGNTLKASVPVQISAAGFFGQIDISYAFYDNKYIMQEIKFTE